MSWQKIILTIFFVLFLIAIFQTKVFAQQLDLPKTVINPDQYLIYMVKRLFEKAILFTKLSVDSKVDYYQSLTLIRVAELKYVVEHDLLNEVEKSTQRVSYELGILSDYLSSKDQLTEEKQETVNLLQTYKKLLPDLRDKYSANSSYWLLIQHTINSIDSNLEKLK